MKIQVILSGQAHKTWTADTEPITKSYDDGNTASTDKRKNKLLQSAPGGLQEFISPSGKERISPQKEGKIILKTKNCHGNFLYLFINFFCYNHSRWCYNKMDLFFPFFPRMTDVSVANVSNFPFKEIDFLFLINFHQKNEVHMFSFWPNKVI